MPSIAIPLHFLVRLLASRAVICVPYYIHMSSILKCFGICCKFANMINESMHDGASCASIGLFTHPYTKSTRSSVITSKFKTNMRIPGMFSNIPGQLHRLLWAHWYVPSFHNLYADNEKKKHRLMFRNRELLLARY